MSKFLFTLVAFVSFSFLSMPAQQQAPPAPVPPSVPGNKSIQISAEQKVAILKIQRDYQSQQLQESARMMEAQKTLNEMVQQYNAEVDKARKSMKLAPDTVFDNVNLVFVAPAAAPVSSKK